MTNPELINTVRDESGNVTEYYRGHHTPQEVGGGYVIWTTQGLQGNETIVERGFMPKAVITVTVAPEVSEQVIFEHSAAD